LCSVNRPLNKWTPGKIEHKEISWVLRLWILNRTRVFQFYIGYEITYIQDMKSQINKNVFMQSLIYSNIYLYIYFRMLFPNSTQTRNKYWKYLIFLWQYWRHKTAYIYCIYTTPTELYYSIKYVSYYRQQKPFSKANYGTATTKYLIEF
jgi:hypothetical protein